MKDIPFIDDPKNLSAELRRLYSKRIKTKSKYYKRKKISLSIIEKEEVLQKTKSLCHICGKKINIDNVQIDHIIPNSLGGENHISNYLPSCSFCNKYRWNYLPEELMWILKIGVWAKTQIEFATENGKLIANDFVDYEKNRENRRKNKRDALIIDPADYPVRELKDYSHKQKFEK